MILCKNPLLKITMMIMMILFIFVFITDWRTWIGNITFVERIRLKRIRKNKKEEI